MNTCTWPTIFHPWVRSHEYLSPLLASSRHVSLDTVHLLLELGAFGVHARDDVADVSDDRCEDENRDEEFDNDEDVLEYSRRMRNVTHHSQSERRPVKRIGVCVEQRLGTRVTAVLAKVNLLESKQVSKITQKARFNTVIVMHQVSLGQVAKSVNSQLWFSSRLWIAEWSNLRWAYEISLVVVQKSHNTLVRALVLSIPVSNFYYI